MVARTDFNSDWRFHLGDPPGAETPAFDDGGWRALRLPHDWSIELPYDAALEGATGYLPRGVGWYRKRFAAPEDGLAFVLFDGVYNRATLWLNGRELGHHPYGYSPFWYELTPRLEADNVLAVRVDRTRIADSRWYPGSGIYRDVSLIRKHRLHVPLWGSRITTPQVAAERATVRLELEVANRLPDAVETDVVTRIVDPDGRTVARASTPLALTSEGRTTVVQTFALDRPALWSPESPRRFRAVSTLALRGEEVERHETPFGVRTFAFDPATGFHLNGVRTPIKGVCLHHDGGLVGAAVPDAVWRRRLLALKAAGCNAVRVSHNPASEALLELCDTLGFLVQEEFFDEWDRPKDKRHNRWERAPDPLTDGYSLDFAAWAERDLTATVLRDRNRPSIVQWSIGNEIEWTDPAVFGATGYADPDFEGDFFWDLPPSSSDEIVARYRAAADGGTPLETTAHTLARWTRALDPTRPVTANCIFPSVSHLTGFTDALDVVGYSYRRILYDAARERYPEVPVMGTENVGQWHEWQAVEERPAIAGLFVWTGIDYLGEAHGKWPAKTLSTGLLDLAGFAKPSYHLFRSLWTDEPHLRLFTQRIDDSPYRHEAGGLVAREPDGWRRRVWFWHDVNEHWNYAEGEAVAVEAIGNCDTLELHLNGRSLGRRRLADAPDRIVTWLVPFEPGELVVTGERGGATVSHTIRTAAAPARIALSADRDALVADGYDCVHVTARLEDAAGVPVRHLDREIAFDVGGACRVLGVDNGVAALDAHRATRLHTHRGRALLILQAEREPGAVRVGAAAVGAPDLAAPTLSLPARAADPDPVEAGRA